MISDAGSTRTATKTGYGLLNPSQSTTFNCNALFQILTKHEFKFFLFPQISPDGTGATVLVPEALEDLDKDGDDAVSLEEFLAVHDEASKPGAEVRTKHF